MKNAIYLEADAMILNLDEIIAIDSDEMLDENANKIGDRIHIYLRGGKCLIAHNTEFAYLKGLIWKAITE